ncbi:hypothetical protein I9T54_03565, partial [Campylobacter peloridis]|nr:hypothetical protein [Campylobacter peloridis]
LVGNIDFSGNQGKGEEGKDWQNYANYCISQGQCTSMIVGSSDNNIFYKNFDGQGYTLKNINIDFTGLTNKLNYVGIFGNAKGFIVRNINVDYMGGKINTNNAQFIGGFFGVGYGIFSNISLSNIGYISSNAAFTGGFAGFTEGGTYSNISLNNIGYISVDKGTSIGGFVGYMHMNGTYSNISLNNIGYISVDEGNFVGGFAGYQNGAYLKNISLNNIGYISVNKGRVIGGFVGYSASGKFYNISLEKIGNISHIAHGNDYVGGFIGYLMKGDTKFENIFIFFNPNIKIINENGLSGKFFGALNGEATYTLNNIHIYHHENDLANATADRNYWGSTNDKIQIHTYTDKTQANAYKDFLSKVNTIEKPTIPNKPSDNDVILTS